MNTKLVSVFLAAFAVLAACASPTDTSPSPTPLVFPTATLSLPGDPSSLTPVPPGQFTPTANGAVPQPSGTGNLCTDPQAQALTDTLKTAVTTGDGELLSSLVSPANGMDVAYYHSGTVISYDPQQARFLFETTYEANWGLDPASGIEKTGPFHEVVVPALVKMFSHPYTVHCNEVKYGGASYPVNFPYDKGYYSLYFPGTEANGFMDWQTWVVGIEYVGGKPYIYALMQFFWEP